MSLDGAINGDPRSLRTLAEVFIDMMETQSRDNSLPCTFAISIICSILFSDLSRRNVHRLRRRYPDVIRAIIHFLVAPRSNEQRLALSKLKTPTSGNCSCALNNYGDNRMIRDLHDARSIPASLRPASYTKDFSPLEMLLYVFVPSLATIFELTFSCSLSRLLEEGDEPTPLAYGQKTVWPRDQLDAMPYGVLVSIDTLCDWYRFFPETPMSLMRLIWSCYDQVAQGAFPGFLTNVITPFAIVQIMMARLTELEEFKKAKRILPASLFRDALKDMIFFAEGPLAALDAMDDRQIRVALSDNMEMVTLLHEMCYTIFDWLQTAGDAHPNVQSVEVMWCRNRFLTSSARFSALRKPPDVNALPTDFPDWIVKRMRVEAAADPVYHLISYDEFLVRPRVCARRECEGSRFACRRPLRACAGCSHAFYCSRACQKAAWRDAPFPHRAICGKLAETMDALRVATVGFLPTSLFTRSDKCCRDAKVNQDDVKEIVCHLEGIYLRSLETKKFTGTNELNTESPDEVET